MGGNNPTYSLLELNKKKRVGVRKTPKLISTDDIPTDIAEVMFWRLTPRELGASKQWWLMLNILGDGQWQLVALP